MKTWSCLFEKTKTHPIQDYSAKAMRYLRPNRLQYHMELPHGHGEPGKQSRLRNVMRMWVPDETFRLSASDRDHHRLWSDSKQGAVFHCISGRDYRRLVYYFIWKY